MSESNAIQPGYLASVQVGKPLKQDASNVRPDPVEKPIAAESSVGETDRSVWGETAEASAKQTESAGQNSGNLNEMIEQLNGEFKKMQNYLRFERDEDTQRMVVFIKNSETDEVIRQIPSQEFLNLSKNITRFLEMSQPQLADNKITPTGLITHETA